MNVHSALENPCFLSELDRCSMHSFRRRENALYKFLRRGRVRGFVGIDDQAWGPIWSERSTSRIIVGRNPTPPGYLLAAVAIHRSGSTNQV